MDCLPRQMSVMYYFQIIINLFRKNEDKSAQDLMIYAEKCLQLQADPGGRYGTIPG